MPLHDWLEVEWTDGTSTWECRRCGAVDLGRGDPSLPPGPPGPRALVAAGPGRLLTCSENVVRHVLES